MEPNYFTCTLGQAAHHRRGTSANTINEFIESQAQNEPSTAAVGFFSPTAKGQPWNSQVITFKEVRQGSAGVAEALSKNLKSRPNQTVGLLCSSSPEFLFTWLAIIRLGHAALLIAPQCSPSAVAQLCRSCGVESLLYDKIYESLADDSLTEFSKMGKGSMDSLRLPFVGEDLFEVARRPLGCSLPEEVAVRETNVAYLHHTSGTSTGIPKPIPQSHRAAVGVLPILDGRRQASFTTTPLYHGGVADLFRAWTSNALIWLFPGKDVPIMAANICKCLDAASVAAAAESIPEVKYFSSVPYVLQMMADNENGLVHLQRMDLVGVGGAALPAEVGDRLVDNKVNLISRFGSAECGFLMSSDRDFEKDKEWQYLRSSSGKEYLKFEPQEDGLSELVIQPGWPHMAKRNCDDGSYATADLFSPHGTIPNAWRYHSRADSQLTLITGKKFDPAPLEDAIRASSPLIDDVLIFGNGKPYPGALLFRSKGAASIDDSEIIKELSSHMEKLNQESQSHARISRNMFILVPHTDRPLEKSSKGTILRRPAEDRYADMITQAYQDILPDLTSEVPDADIPNTIRHIVSSVVGERGHTDQDSLDDETDLFAYGVDSVGGIQIRHALSRLIPRGSALPLTVVEDQGTISRLAALVLRIRSGDRPNGTTHDQDTDQQRLMLDLVRQYSTFNDPHHPPSPQATSTGEKHASSGVHIILTGPTGSLGSHILGNLLSDPRISHIHLLVRGSTQHASLERVRKALTSRLLPIPKNFASKTTIYQCKLSDPALGLSTADYARLSCTVDVIVHLAWSVNFLLPLRTFAATHLSWLRNLIDLALASPRPTPPRLIFCSSVASVSRYSAAGGAPVPEASIEAPSSSGPTGYARSKWVAEAMCTAAHKSTRLRDRISISRVGQLSGASDTGVWSASEAYPLMLSSVKATRVLPDLKGEVLSWLPVDLAARAFVEDILSDATSRTTHDGLKGEAGDVLSDTSTPGPAHNGLRDLGRDVQSDTPSSPTPNELKDVGEDVSSVTTTGGTLPDHNRHKSNDKDSNEMSHGDDMPVHHVLNPHHDVEWSDLLACLARRESFQVVTVDTWLSRLSELQDVADTKDHPALRLLGFWKNAYGVPDPASEAPPSHDPIQYEMKKTYARMPCLETDTLKGVNERYFLDLWEWIKHNV